MLTVGLVAGCAVAALSFAPAARAATVTVDTTADQYNTDPSHCSLREAIKSVDGTTGGDSTGTNFGGCVASGPYATSVDPPDTIMLPAGTYQLTLSGSSEDSDVSGDLDIFRAMNIVGTGNPTIRQTVARAGARRHRNGQGRLSHRADDHRRGRPTPGGGIHFVGSGPDAELTLDEVTVTGNSLTSTVTAQGGGIWADAPVVITGSVITGNGADTTASGTGNGGGLYQDGALGTDSRASR